MYCKLVKLLISMNLLLITDKNVCTCIYYIFDTLSRNKKTSDKSLYINKLKQSVQYYFNGTEDGFLRYNPPPSKFSCHVLAVLKGINSVFL